MSRTSLLGVPAIMTCVGRCKSFDDTCEGLGVPELVMNYEIDEVLPVKVCQARLAGLDSCSVGLAMTVPESFVYLGVPVLIYNRVGNI